MLFGKKCKYCGEEYSRFKHTHCPYCGDIDFANIDSVTIMDTEMTYRTETEEEFDPVMTNFLTDMDGWQHYETKTIEYEVEMVITLHLLFIIRMTQVNGKLTMNPIHLHNDYKNRGKK